MNEMITLSELLGSLVSMGIPLAAFFVLTAVLPVQTAAILAIGIANLTGYIEGMAVAIVNDDL